MGRLWGNLGVGFAVGALLAALPAFADTVTVTAPSTDTVNQASQITDDTTAVNVDVVGGGIAILSNAANSYTGGTTVNGGTTLQVTVDSNLGAAAGGITLGDATVPTGGATSANLGILDLSTGTAAVTSARTIVLDAGGGTIITGANPWTLSGVISGSGVFTVTGGGTLVLSGANTYAGGLTINDNSTVKVSAPTNLSAGTITLGGTTTGSGQGTLDLSLATATETAANPIVLNAGGGTITTSTNNWTLTGVISSTGPLTYDGAGTITPTGTNTYTGGTTISGGATVVISADAQLGAAASGATGPSVTLGDATTKGILQLDSAGAVTSTLLLNLGAGGGTINVADHPWTITSGISGTGGLDLNGTGTLILEGANTYTGDTTVTTGVLQLGNVSGTTVTTSSLAGNVVVATGGTFTGFGSVAGNLMNSGVVAPGHGSTIGTLTVAGNYTQASTGTLSIEVTPGGASDLKVGGTASLAGTLHLVLDGQLHAGTYQLIDAGAVTGTFSTVTNTLSVALSERIDYSSPTLVDLVLTQLTTLPENPTVFSDIESTAIDGGQAANSTLLSHLTGIRNGAAVDQMTMVNTSSHRAGFSDGASPYGAWAQGQGGFGSVNGSGSSPSYNIHGGGFMAGIDRQISPGAVLGAAIGYDITSLSESGGASATLDTPRVAVYGGYWWGRLAFDGTLGVGLPSITSDRPVSQTGTTASSSYDGTEITAAGQVSSTFGMGDYAITPAIGTQYTRLRLHSFSEAGAGGFDLGGPSSTTESLRPFVAATASTRFFWDTRTVLEPTVRVAYSYEALSNNRQVTIEPEGDNAIFQFDGVKPSRGEGSVDAGLMVETSHDLGFYSNAAVVGIGNTSGVKLDAGVRYRF